MTTRILVATDGSPSAERAVPVAAALARVTRATVEVLSVAAVDPGEPPESRGGERGLPAAQTAANAVARVLRAVGIPAEAMAVVDEPAEGIVRFAQARGVRLIVMATHGRGGLGRWLHGSDAEAVVRRSSIPVVLVRAQEDGAALQPPDGTPTILVPLDGSALAETALPPARRLAELSGGRLLLLQVVPVPVVDATSANVSGADLDVALLVDAEREAATAYLASRAAALGDGVAVDMAVKIGQAADAIA